MKGNIHTLFIQEQAVTVYEPVQTDTESLCCIFLAGSSSVNENELLVSQIMTILEPAVKKGILPPFLLVSPSVQDWDTAYAPWAATLGERTFAGEADAYFVQLQTVIYPYLCRQYPLNATPKHTAFIGYSLAGLTALYGYLHTTLFGKCASVSGSLWYPDWISHLQQEIDNTAPDGKVYISLGKAEVKTRSLLMRQNKKLSEQTQALFSQQLGADKVCLEWNNGNHFFEVPQRQAKAILWLFGKSE